MAPKGTKRAATQAPVDQPDAKQLANTLKKSGITKATFTTLLQIVNHDISQATLPESCRKMLVAALPHSICVPSDVRQEQQDETIQMLGELAENIQQQLQKAYEAEDARLADFEAKKAEFETQAHAAEVTLAQAAEVTAGRTAELVEASGVFLDRKEALAERRVEQEKGDREIVAVRADKETLETVHGGSFHTLKTGSWEEGKQNQLLNDVKSIASKLQVEDSMLTALPSSLTKPPVARGQFDLVVLGQFEQALQSTIAKLTAAEQAEVAPAAVRAAAVEAAEAAQEAAGRAQQAGADALAEAKEEEAKAAATLAAARAEFETYGPEYASATEARDAKQMDFAIFRDLHVATFFQLRDRISKVPEKQQADEESPQAMETEAAVAGA